LVIGLRQRYSSPRAASAPYHASCVVIHYSIAQLDIWGLVFDEAWLGTAQRRLEFDRSCGRGKLLHILGAHATAKNWLDSASRNQLLAQISSFIILAYLPQHVLQPSLENHTGAFCILKCD
jgi:hypothetical protein